MSITEILKIIKNKNSYVVKSCLIISVVSVVAWITKLVLFKKRNKRKQNHYNQQYEIEKIIIPLVVITGCDTGLGYSIVMKYLNSAHCHENLKDVSKYNIPVFNTNKLIIPSNIAIVAFCLNPNGSGAKCLLQHSLKSKNIHLFVRQLDFNDKDSIKNGVIFVSDLLEQNIDENNFISNEKGFKYELHALVNNAGRMVMAEYEWQTTQLIQQQFEVNILGPIMLTAQLLPLIRKYKSRVINITSHCAYLPLPGISIYGATKAAVRAWTIGSRIELENHGVRMITFSPGSFCLHSSIMSAQQRIIDFKHMREQMTEEQLAYYDVYFDTYQNYLSSIEAYINSPETTIPSTNKIYAQMDSALWANQPKAEYTVPEPWRYRIYYALAWTLSVFGLHHLKDEVVCSFVATPRFKNIVKNQNKNISNL